MLKINMPGINAVTAHNARWEGGYWVSEGDRVTGRWPGKAAVFCVGFVRKCGLVWGNYDDRYYLKLALRAKESKLHENYAARMLQRMSLWWSKCRNPLMGFVKPALYLERNE